MDGKICTNCFKSLGVASRMSIYNFLANTPNSSVNQIVEAVKLTQPTVSYHLKEMKENGILLSKKRGKEVLYTTNTLCPHSQKECVLSGIKFETQK